MNGKERFEAAFSKEGTKELPVAVSYEWLMMRDHWNEFTDCPWWYYGSPSIEEQVAWREDYLRETGSDWVRLCPFYPKTERENFAVEERNDGIFIVNKLSGKETRMAELKPGGDGNSNWNSSERKTVPDTPEKIDEIFLGWNNFNEVFFPERFKDEGRSDLACAIQQKFPDKYTFYQTGIPFSWCIDIWGMENAMMTAATNPELIGHASKRALENIDYYLQTAAALGVKSIWIEAVAISIISVDMYKRLVEPYIISMLGTIRSLGMKSILYYTGNPAPKWKEIMSLDIDALALENSMKEFRIDIVEIAKEVRGKFVLFGNIDAIGILQKGSKSDLEAEIKRQVIGAGANKGRFVMCAGSPITPETSLERIRQYTDLAHAIGKI